MMQALRRGIFEPADVTKLVQPGQLWRSWVWTTLVAQSPFLLNTMVVGQARFFTGGDCAYAVALGIRRGHGIIGSLCYRDDPSDSLPPWRRDTEFHNAHGFATAFARMNPRTSWPYPRTPMHAVPLGYRRIMVTRGTTRHPYLYMSLVQQDPNLPYPLAALAAARSLSEVVRTAS
jgi:hypothetical protein